MLTYASLLFTIVTGSKATDYAVHSNFALEMLQQQENYDFLDCVVFSDESTFHLNGKVNTHNVRIWGSENPCEFVQSERETPKLNVFCALSRRKVSGPFFFVEANITGMTYQCSKNGSFLDC